MNLSVSEIRQRIYTVRGHRVMLDNELAELYQTETKLLNKAVGRNSKSFPADFVFQLVKEEYESLRFQIGTLKTSRGGHRKYLPHAFTEQGVAMVSSVLHSDRAIEVNIAIMRTFVQLREVSETHLDLAKKFDQLERKHDDQFKLVFEAIRQLTSLNFSREAATPLISSDELEVKLSEAQYGPGNPIIKKEHRSRIEAIQHAVTKYFGVRIQELKTDTRIRAVVLPRQIAMYLIRNHTGIGFQEIGRCFGGKDHTTVLFACKKIAAAIEKDETIREALQTIQNSLLN